MSKKKRIKKGCPECGGDLELETSIAFNSKIWHCTGLVDPENSQAELKPCDYQRDFGKRK